MRRRHDRSSGSLVRSSRADPLSDVLRSVRLSGALFFLWRVSAPYVTPVPAGRAFAPIILPGAQQIVSYHIVTRGACWGALAGEAPVRLQAGDVLLIPHGDAYVMSSASRSCSAPPRGGPAPALQFFRQMAAGDLPFVVEEGGGGEATHLICGFLGCDVRPFNPVLAALPRLVHLPAQAGAAGGRLQALVDYALAEAREPRAGGDCVLVRLSELMFVEVVRRWLAVRESRGEAQDKADWLAGLRHPLVGRALARLHGEPGRAWTLARLARELGSSRSRLAESFARLVGQPPMQYLAQWRMQLAARMLADGPAKVASVAREVGYESEASFSRAFKRLVGASPAQWRRGEKGPGT